MDDHTDNAGREVVVGNLTDAHAVDFANLAANHAVLSQLVRIDEVRVLLQELEEVVGHNQSAARVGASLLIQLLGGVLNQLEGVGLGDGSGRNGLAAVLNPSGKVVLVEVGIDALINLTSEGLVGLLDVELLLIVTLVNDVIVLSLCRHRVQTISSTARRGVCHFGEGVPLRSMN